jgi:hypothetical protein
LERNINSFIMKDLSDNEADDLKGGASGCATSILLSTSIGGLFGGVGAAIGFLGSALGPACLAVL